ncbi:M23 family metallopeptidase [Candidatus Uhrbacteria bacterium]|nr:M23 family metallopeptidase [Candidatus Uhrbacteria bacterium]
MGRVGLISLIFFLGAGCVAPGGSETPKPTVAFPVENYREGRWFKSFGEYLDDRFTGYHVADDVEADVAGETPVKAVKDGVVRRVDYIGGYGGLVAIEHGDVTALYGHMDLGSVSLKAGDSVSAGQIIGNLGDDKSEETDGEREHLHFGLYKEGERKIHGYEQQEAAVQKWLNPNDWFAAQGQEATSPSRTIDPAIERGGDVLRLSFDLPAGWEVEWVPQLEAWNLFAMSGEGSARERSQMFIRYFDASDFLTLSTVTIYSAEDLKVGRGNYTARRYDIEKKPGVPDFPDQPAWRNERHIVTDFRDREGATRYYVVAAAPGLDPKIYEEVLASVRVSF